MKALWIFKLFPSKVRGRSTHIRADIQIKLKKKRVMSSINYQLSARILIFFVWVHWFFLKAFNHVFSPTFHQFFLLFNGMPFFFKLLSILQLLFYDNWVHELQLFYYITPIFFYCSNQVVHVLDWKLWKKLMYSNKVFYWFFLKKIEYESTWLKYILG
jgi:hypothetical protein